ncbi:MAG TPA: hypothetical protein ENN81_13625, partial [Phycisphaerales bacterium]|nr:hypothetical protein [Phycisphaerales bacterium]
MPDNNIEADKPLDESAGYEGPPPGVMLRWRRPLIVVAHVMVFVGALMMAFLLTSEMQFQRKWLVEQYPLLLALFIPIKLAIFGLFKQYRGWWRYVGISDLFGILRASLVSTMVTLAVWFASLNLPAARRHVGNLEEVSQAVFMLDMFATILLLA